MKRFAFPSLLMACLLTCRATEFQQRIAFEREDFVCIANRDGTDAKKVATGSFPALSPDGRRVVFTTTEKTGNSYLRRIAVADVASGITNLFKEIPSENVYYATWAPDGKRILFTLRVKFVWDLGVIDADGTNFHTIKKGAQNETTLYSPVWSRDGESIFCQDMTNIYRLDLKGAVLTQWKVETIVPNGNMSGDGRITVSPDGKRLLLGIDMGEEQDRKDWDGPPPALWTFDLTTQKATRVTPKKIFGWDGCWLDNDNILFLSQDANEKEPSIYRMSLGKNGKDRKLVIKHGRMPSASQ
jgi:TolB protein